MPFICDWSPATVDKIILRVKKNLNYGMKRIEIESQNIFPQLYSFQKMNLETI